jgi:F-type H+-transporting ATPase subunit gamma
MASIREMRNRIRSVKNLSQVTKALETVSASKVRRAVAAYSQTLPYAEKAWKLLLHLARQPGSETLHPLLTRRETVRAILVILVSSDRGLAGAYNVNIVRHTLQAFRDYDVPVEYVAVGRKGETMLLRRGRKVIADFTGLPANPRFVDCAPIGQLVIDDFLSGRYDQVYIAYTEFINMLRQEPRVRRLLPLEPEIVPMGMHQPEATHETKAVFTYEPGHVELLNEILPRFTSLQIYRAILSAVASEHAARMVAMRNATDNARELIAGLQLDYNKARQQAITSDMLDISAGAEALAQKSAER